MSSDHFDRKDLKHDPYQDAFFAAVQYVYQNRRWFIIGAVALVVVVAAGASGYAYLQHEDRVESDALMDAASMLSGPVATSQARYKTAADAFQAFVDKYPRSNMTPSALMYLARIAWDDKAYAKAAANFQKVLDLRKTPPVLRAEALVGLGKLKELEGKPAEAVALYEQMAEQFQDLKQLSLGRAAMAAGNLKEAREHFLQAQSAQGYQGVTLQAKEALDYLPQP